MSGVALVGLDIVAVSLLVFGLYFPRHRRRDLVAAYLGVNIGVLAVAIALVNSETGVGLGLGFALFGVLSIIRLRSTELDQQEVAYYFCALALGILGAISAIPMWLSASLMGLILVVMFIGDHSRLFRGYRRQILVLDSAITDEVALTAQAEQLLGARVHSARVQRLDLVNDTTTVEVRYSHGGRGVTPAPALANAHRGAHR